MFETINCKSCDTYFRFEFDYVKQEFTIGESIEECPCAEHKMKFTLDIPSKELVFINDIRHVFEAERKDPYKHSVNSFYGKILECEEYLKHNIAYISLSSGGVDILHSKKEKMVVIDFDMDSYYKSPNKNLNQSEDDDEDDWSDCEDKNPIEGFKKEGDISLELWGVFVMDKKSYEDMCKKEGLDIDSYDVNVKIKGTKLEVNYNLDELLVEMKYS